MGNKPSKTVVIVLVFLLFCLGFCFLFVKTAGQSAQVVAAQTVPPTLTPKPSPTPTLAPSGGFTITAKLSADRLIPYKYSYGKYAVSFDQVTDLGDRVGGNVTYTEVFQINPEFRDSHHLIGIYVTVSVPSGGSLLWRKSRFEANGDQFTEKNLAYILDTAGVRYDLGIVCQKNLETCGGLADNFMPGYNVFDQLSTFVMVFAVPNDLDELTLYTTWEYNDGTK